MSPSRAPNSVAAPARRRRLLDPDARPRWQGYVFALVATVVTLLARHYGGFAAGDHPIVILFVVPIMLSAMIGGLGPGLVATAVAALGVLYFLLPPQYSFAVATPTHLVSWSVLIAVGAMTSVLIEALYRSRRRLEAAEHLAAVTLASIGDAVVTTDIAGRITYLNGEAQRLTGWSRDEARGRPLTDVLRVVRATTREPLADPVAQILQASAPVNLAQNVLLIARDGRELAIDDSGAPIRGRDGAARGVVIVFRDCSSRRDAEAALRESEERLRLAQDSGGVGVFDFDVASGRLTWSQSLRRIYGLPEAAQVERYDDWRDRIHPDDVDRVEQEWRPSIAGVEPMNSEFRIVRPSGEVRWVAATGTALRRGDGTPYRVVGVAVDVSERKRSEEQVRRVFDVLTLAQRASHSGVFDFDFEGGTAYCSPQFCDLYGVPANTVMTHEQWLERVHPDDRERMREANERLMREGSEWSAEFRIVHPVRGERWIAGRGTLSRDASGRALRFTGADMDVTAMRRAQQALLESEMRFRSYVHNAPVAMIVSTLEGHIVDCNPAAVELFGYGAATLRTLHAAKLVSPDDYDSAAAAMRAIVEHGEYAGELRAVTGDGRPLWVSVRGVRLGDDHLLGFCSDITARRRAEAGLRRSEARLRELIESLPQLVWTCTPDGRCDYVNPQALAYTGAPSESHYGIGWLGFVHEDDRAALAAAFKKARAESAQMRCEVRSRRHDGIYRWFEARMAPLRDEAGTLVKWLGLASDIDDARELRETLRREKERFTQLASAVPGIVHTFAIEADGTPTFRYASPRIVEIYGIDAETLALDASRVFALIDPDDVPRMRASIEQSARTMTTWREEFRVRHPDKGEIWVEGYSAPMRDADGTIVWHGILLEVTSRKRMEEALRTSRSQLLAALDAGGMGAWTWDAASDRFVWDESMNRVLGIDVSDAVDANLDRVLELIHSADRDGVRSTIEALLRNGTHASGEYRIAQRDGSMRWIEYTARVERDAAGRAVRVVGINVDITNRKRAEETQLRSQKLEALGTLAGGIAHDFNNILVAITGNTKLAKSDLPRGHPAQESLDEIARAGARAVDLVRRILTFSRPYDHKREVLALAPVVDEALKLVRATLPAMVKIRTHYGADLPRVSIDPTQIHQIIVNLATNAAHAIGAHGGHIDVRIEPVAVGPDFATHKPGLREGRHVRLEVADDGCGMDRATVERIFDPFFTTKPQGLGTGLGLSVVHGIVKSHNGAISVYSEPDHGTSFRLYFPAADAPALVPPPPAPTRPHGAHVMFVDDEPSLVMLVSRMLERIGYRVSGLSDAAKALAEFRANPQRYDAVVTDLAMGGMSGFDLAREVLALRPDLPVVMTSGFVRSEDQQAAAELGVRALVLKPDTVEELGYVLNRALHETAGSAPPGGPRG